MSTALVPTDRADVAVEDPTTLLRVRRLKLALPDLSAGDLQAAIIWAQAVNAAGRAQRAWDLAREASDCQIRAERRLGQILADHVGGRDLRAALSGEGRVERLPIDYKQEGALLSLGRLPSDIFEATVTDLLDRRKSVDVRTVLRQAHLRSLQEVAEGVCVAWDGAYFIRPDGRPRRSKATSLDAAQAELHEAVRLSRRLPKSSIARSLDAAFAEARRDAQSLSRLGEGVHGEAGRLIAEAELMQAKVAEVLFRAYRVVESRA